MGIWVCKRESIGYRSRRFRETVCSSENGSESVADEKARFAKKRGSRTVLNFKRAGHMATNSCSVCVVFTVHKGTLVKRARSPYLGVLC